MRVGICAFWFNRGQGVVARQLRSALDELGHETFVLGRPTKESFPMPQEAREDDVWAQEGVTPASDFFIPAAELVGFGRMLGAVIGGLLLGAASSLLGAYLPAGLLPFRDAIVFSLPVAILIFKPRGLLGAATGEARV